MLSHPGFRSCESCKRWMYDPKTGELSDRNGKPIRRPLGVITPCHCCPKVAGCKTKTPEEGRTFELSDKNQKTYELYLHLHGARLSGDNLDPIAKRNMAVIHSIIAEPKRG